MVRFPDGWQVSADGRRVEIEFSARDFLDALDLFHTVGAVAEELEHHPDLHLEKWNHVRIVSYSHDVGGLTKRDEALVSRIDALLRSRAHLK